MIVAKLMGGLGNQMFQYAAAKNYSLINDLPLRIDTSFLENRNRGADFVYRDYDLDLLSVVDDIWTPGKGHVTVRERQFHYSEDAYQQADRFIAENTGFDLIFNGYWQSPKYFTEHVEEIRELYKFKNPVSKKRGGFKDLFNEIDSCESVMIHVRRGDYLNTNYHGVVSDEYIKQAAKVLRGKLSKVKFFVFSDDLDWCKANIKLRNCFFVEQKFTGDRFEYYIQLMSRCKHHIISNSTYSWWSAWLSNNPDQHVIAPKKWFTDPSINTDDLIPEKWTRI